MNNFKGLSFKEKILAICASILDVVMQIGILIAVLISIPIMLILYAMAYLSVLFVCFAFWACDGLFEFISKHSLFQKDK